MSSTAPEVQVKIGGTDLDTTDCKIERVEVSLNKEDCSSAVIWLQDAYKDENHGINSTVRNHILLGKKVEVSMGYAGGKAQVFSGYLDAVELAASGEEDYMVCLRAYDVIKLLKETVQCRMFTEGSYSAVVTGVLGAYSWLCTTNVESTDELEEERTWQQDGSDFDFITEKLVTDCPANREFYVSLGKVNYKEPTPKETVVMTKDSNTDCLGFSAKSKYVNKTIQIQGYSPDYEKYLGGEDACVALLDSAATKGMQVLLIPDGTTQSDVDALAEKYAKKQENQALQIHISVPGRQDLLVGTYVEIKEMDTIWNGTYQIWEAVHVYDEEGYRTDVVLGGC